MHGLGASRSPSFTHKCWYQVDLHAVMQLESPAKLHKIRSIVHRLPHGSKAGKNLGTQSQRTCFMSFGSKVSNPLAPPMQSVGSLTLDCLIDGSTGLVLTLREMKWFTCQNLYFYLLNLLLLWSFCCLNCDQNNNWGSTVDTSHTMTDTLFVCWPLWEQVRSTFSIWAGNAAAKSWATILLNPTLWFIFYYIH
jgi:hypothetical protein